MAERIWANLRHATMTVLSCSLTCSGLCEHLFRSFAARAAVSLLSTQNHFFVPVSQAMRASPPLRRTISFLTVLQGHSLSSCLTRILHRWIEGSMIAEIVRRNTTLHLSRFVFCFFAHTLGVARGGTARVRQHEGTPSMSCTGQLHVGTSALSAWFP